MVSWILLLEACVLLGSLATPSSSTPSPQEFYVDAELGDDGMGDGSKSQPFRSIQKCVDALVVTTYETIQEICTGGESLGGLTTNDIEMCADMCRLHSDCEFFILSPGTGKYWCKKANVCGGNSGYTKYRAVPASEWAPVAKTCIIGEGTYHESIIIHHVKGSETSPVTIRAAPGSNVSIDGTIAVEGWTEHMRLPLPSGGEAIIWESSPVSQNVWQLWMQPQGQSVATPKAERRFEMMVPARWPNARFSDRSVFRREFWGKQRHSLQHGCALDCSEHGCRQDLGFKKAADCTTEEALHGLLIDDGSGSRNLSSATWNGQPLDATGAIAVMNSGSWQTFQQVVSHHTPGTDRFNYSADFVLYKFETNGYFLEGKKEFLDGPEEWWIDKATRKVYLITDDDNSPSLHGRMVRGKTVDYCISITHAAHLIIEGFHIFGCAVKSSPTYPYFAGPLTIASNEFFFPSVTKRALGHPMTDKSPSMSWLYTWGRSNDDEQLPLTIYNNTWFGAEGTALNYRGQVTLDNNLFLNNDFTGVEGRDGNIGLAVIVGIGKTNTTVFTHNSILYNGPSVSYAVDSAGALVQGNIVAGQCFGMIQNDGSHIQTMTQRQNHTVIKDNWGFDSPKGSFRFDDAAQCFSNTPDCIGHFGTMQGNVDLGTRGIMVKGNNHKVLNNLAIGSELRVYDMFKNNDCPDRCMNNFTTAQGNLGTALVIQRSMEILADPYGQDLHNVNVDVHQLDAMMPGYKVHDFRPLAGSAVASVGPYEPRDPEATEASHYFIPGQRAYRPSYPIPPDKSIVDYDVSDVMFRPALGASHHRVWLGCNREAVEVAGTPATCEDLTARLAVMTSGDLAAPLNVVPIRSAIRGACTTYYWRVDFQFPGGEILRGDVWEFSRQDQDYFSGTQTLVPTDDAIANLQWGLDKTWPVLTSGPWTEDSVQLGPRSGSPEVHFDYFVKFRLENLQGAHLQHAEITMTKFAATLSDELRTPYDVGDEDDHLTAWAISREASGWSRETLSRRLVEDTITQAQRPLATIQNVGHTGTASFDITAMLIEEGGRILDGNYSFRFSTGSRRRLGSPEHYNAIYAAMGNRMIQPKLKLDLHLPEAPQVAVNIVSIPDTVSNSNGEATLSWTQASDIGTTTTQLTSASAIYPTESARIAARQGASSAWGGGDSSNPVGLRSCDYTVKANTPYEWFVKFDTSALSGKTIINATLSVSKCRSSTDCVDNCKLAGKCTCSDSTDGQKSCGGSNIDAVYDPSDDDLHLWHVSNGWSSSWTFNDYLQSFDVTSNSCNQESLLSGTGALEFVNYAGHAESVGHAGTAIFDISSLVQASSSSGDHILSFRLTVNGTSQRFYIPQGSEGEPTITTNVLTTIHADERWYEVEEQTWDTYGLEPSGTFSQISTGPSLSSTLIVPASSSSRARVRAVARARIAQAVNVSSSWTQVELFKQDPSQICATTITSSTGPITGTMHSSISSPTSFQSSTSQPSSSTGTIGQSSIEIDWRIPVSQQSVTINPSNTGATTITFKWSGFHNVYQMPSAAAMNSCDFSGAQEIAPSSSGGSVTVDAPAAGETNYYACEVGFGSHCGAGQIVAITSEVDTPSTTTSDSETLSPSVDSTILATSAPTTSLTGAITGVTTGAGASTLPGQTTLTVATSDHIGVSSQITTGSATAGPATSTTGAAMQTTSSTPALRLPPFSEIDLDNNGLVGTPEVLAWYFHGEVVSPEKEQQLREEFETLAQQVCGLTLQCSEAYWSVIRVAMPCPLNSCSKSEEALEMVAPQLPEFDEVDVNHDGVVTKSEILAWYFKGELVNPAKEEQLSTKFELLANEWCGGNSCDRTGWAMITQLPAGSLSAFPLVDTEATPNGNENNLEVERLSVGGDIPLVALHFWWLIYQCATAMAL